MNLTEDQLRAVLMDAGDEIAPDRLRPLDLQSQQASRPASRNQIARWRRSRWLQGLAAAAAVTAVAIAATAIATGTSANRGGTTTAVTPPAEALVRGVPPYYLYLGVLTGKSGKHGLPTVYDVTDVRDTRTGAVLASVHAPHGYRFIDAGAGSDNDSFLLAAFPAAPPRDNPSRLYLLRFNPATRDTSLSKLPIPAIPYLAGITMSPSGSELAVASAGPRGSQLRIYSLSGQLIRQWQDPGWICSGTAYQPCLAWVASGDLAFAWVNHNTPAYGGYISGSSAGSVRMLRATAASGSLLSASRLAVPFASPTYSNFVLSGNGATIVGGVQLGRSRAAFEEFSAATGKLTGRFWLTDYIDVGNVFWSNGTGSTLVVVAPVPRAGRHHRMLLGILAGGRFTPLPSPPLPWQSIAF